MICHTFRDTFIAWWNEIPAVLDGGAFFAGALLSECTIIAKRTVLEKCPSENPPR
jgi:hypothetical protein